MLLPGWLTKIRSPEYSAYNWVAGNSFKHSFSRSGTWGRAWSECLCRPTSWSRYYVMSVSYNLRYSLDSSNNLHATLNTPSFNG